MTRRFWRAITVIGAVIAFSGCSASSESASESEPSLGPVPVITAPEQVTFPIDAFVPSVDQQVAVVLHGEWLLNECLAAYGDNNHFVVGENGNISGFRDFLIGLERESVTVNSFWGLFDPDLMRRQGYDLTGTRSGPSLDYDNEDSPHLEACFQAVAEISPFGAVVGSFTPALLPDGGSLWHPEDSRWVAAVAEWSACMADRGYGYAIPPGAVGARVDDAQYPDVAMQHEATALATAVADLDCKLETNLVGKGVAIQSAYDQLYIDSHRDELAAQQAQIAVFLVAGVDALPDINSWTPPTPEPSS